MLAIGADEEFLGARDLKSPLFVEGDGAGILGKDAEPDGTRAFGIEDGEGAVHEGAGEAGAVVGGIEIELAELGCGGGLEGSGERCGGRRPV